MIDLNLRNDKKVLLRLNNIGMKFKDLQVLTNLSFTINEGEIFGFLGPSGAGKTTTLNIVTGQLKATSGQAFTLDLISDKINENVYEQIGISSDTSGVYERLSVYDNLKVFADILNVPYTRIDDLLERVGLEERKKLPAKKLSKGEKQRLNIARAILHKPKLLFLDEPTSGLDPTTTQIIQDLFLELKDEGMGIFLTTHNMEEATRLCDKVALLDKGVIIECGSPQDICFKYNGDKKYKAILKSNLEEHVIFENNSEDLQLLNELLLDNKVESLHSCEPTLGDVFIKVTGRGLV